MSADEVFKRLDALPYDEATFVKTGKSTEVAPFIHLRKGQKKEAVANLFRLKELSFRCDCGCQDGKTGIAFSTWSKHNFSDNKLFTEMQLLHKLGGFEAASNQVESGGGTLSSMGSSTFLESSPIRQNSNPALAAATSVLSALLQEEQKLESMTASKSTTSVGPATNPLGTLSSLSAPLPVETPADLVTKLRLMLQGKKQPLAAPPPLSQTPLSQATAQPVDMSVLLQALVQLVGKATATQQPAASSNDVSDDDVVEALQKMTSGGTSLLEYVEEGDWNDQRNRHEARRHASVGDLAIADGLLLRSKVVLRVGRILLALQLADESGSYDVFDLLLNEAAFSRAKLKPEVLLGLKKKIKQRRGLLGYAEGSHWSAVTGRNAKKKWNDDRRDGKKYGGKKQDGGEQKQNGAGNGNAGARRK
jgi:hypothetical protein